MSQENKGINEAAIFLGPMNQKTDTSIENLEPKASDSGKQIPNPVPSELPSIDASIATIPAVPLLSDKAVAVLAAHRQELLDNFKFVWGEYMKWFSFFCGFNLIALGVVQKIGAPPGFSPFVAAFLTISILSSGSSVYMFAYSKRVCGNLEKLSADLCRQTVPVPEHDSVSRKISSTLPSPLTVWAASVNFVAIAIFIAMWVYIYINGISPAEKNHVAASFPSVPTLLTDIASLHKGPGVHALKLLQSETAAELDALLPATLDRAFKGEL